MTDLRWPGDHRALTSMSDVALLRAMVAVERTWLAALIDAGIAPPEALDDLAGLVGEPDIDVIATVSEDGGNPAIAMVRLLRQRVHERAPAAALWLHRGLTSQDVIDTAMVLCLRDAIYRIAQERQEQITCLLTLAEIHADTAMVGRTLTQHAVPTTFGAKAAAWLDGLLDASELLDAAAARLPLQLGGAVGTMAASTEMARLSGAHDPVGVVGHLVAAVADRLGLRSRRPWHATRGPLTAAADAMVGYTDLLGHIAADVATLSRPEIGELSESVSGRRGESSTMPDKHNPVLAILIRRAALAAPGMAATLHTAAAAAVDERPDGAWHVEWATVRTLVRRTVIAASQATELLQGLEVHTDRMAATLDAAKSSVLGEQRRIESLFSGRQDRNPAAYLGLGEVIVRGATERARQYLKETP